MDKKETKKSTVTRKKKSNVSESNKRKKKRPQGKNTPMRSSSMLSYQQKGKKRKKKRKKMSKTERYIHIAIRWTIFFALVILLLWGIGKGLSAAFHALTGSSKPKTVQEATTGEMAPEESSTAETTIKTKKKKVSNKPIEITISAVGDCTLGTDERYAPDGGFNQIYDQVRDPEYFFANVKSIFEADDLTIANLEGTLTWEVDMKDGEDAFKGSTEYAKILSAGSVEAVNLANDHTMDYGEKGYNDTIEFLAQTKVKSFGNDRNIVMEVNGVQVGLFGINATGSDLDTYKEQVVNDITALKDQGAQLIIASFHWGISSENYPTEMQQTLGHLAIDSGADLVLGHNPHVLQGIEEYNGKNIVYSLGNFCYGANAHPSDMDTMIYQQTFTVTGYDVASDMVTKIIPCKVSSESGGNNYQPTPAEDEEKEKILANIETYTAGIGKSEEVPSGENTTAEQDGDTTDTDEVQMSTETSENQEGSETSEVQTFE